MNTTLLAARVLLAGAATVATLVLYGTGHERVAPIGANHSVVTADGDDNFVNDFGQTSGDEFQQNAQNWDGN